MLRLLTFLSFLLLAGAAQATQLFVNAPKDGYLNLRAGPSTAYEVQYQMPHGTEVEILRKEDGWARIRHESGRTGWASSRYLTTWAEEQPRRPGREPGQQTSDVPQGDLPVFFVDAPSHGGLNLRNGPGTGNSVLTVMAHGDRVEELGSRGDWRLLRAPGGQIGWAHGGYLSTDKPRKRQPSQTAEGFNPAPGQGQQGGFRPAPGNGWRNGHDNGWRNGNGNGWRNGNGNGWRNGNGHAWRDDRRDDRRARRDSIDLPELLLRCAGRDGDDIANCIARNLIQIR